MDWMSNPAHQRGPRAAPEDTKAIAAAAEAKAREERRAVRCVRFASPRNPLAASGALTVA
jgi:hypothetical protein